MSTPGLQANLDDHTVASLRSLYEMLDDLDRQRTVVTDCIESITGTFQRPAPKSFGRRTRPKPDQPAQRRRVSQYPSDRNETGDSDCDLSHLSVDFTGTRTLSDRIYRIADAAHNAGKQVNPSMVGAFLIAGHPDYRGKAQEYMRNTVSRRINREPHRYRCVEHGVYVLVSPPSVEDELDGD